MLRGKSDEEKIINFLKDQKVFTIFGIYGLVGNLKAESGLVSINLQNSFNKKLSITDEEYTRKVDDGSYTNFVRDSAGYGLAQWTYWARKQNLLNNLKSKKLSIGDLEGQLVFLMQELKGYKSVWRVLTTAKSIKEASDSVLLDFEKPRDQSESVKKYRASLGEILYNKYENVKGGTSMAVKIGHASIDENGKANRGKAGDQTGKEVCIRDWYNKGWTVLIRAKEPEIAEKMAQACEQGCNNPNIGYDQYQRNTLRTQARSAGWNLSKIAVPCETDCSAFMTVCAEAAGVPMDSTYTSGNAPVCSTMRNKFKSTGYFDILTDARYLTSSDYVKRGDILVYEKGHTVMVLSNGAKISGVEESSAINNSFVGKGIGRAVAKSAMNVRAGNNTTYTSYGVIPVGTEVEVLEVLSNKWYKIVYTKCELGYAYVSNSTGKYFDYTPNTTSVKSDKKAVSAKSKDLSLAGTYKTTANLNLRTNPGSTDPATVMVVMPKGTQVKNYGFYTDVSGVKWLYVQVTVNGVQYTGFCSKKYLNK